MKPSSASIAETVSFPLEAESFNELQAKLAGRQLSEGEKKINIAYMEIINGYHEDGKNGGEWESIIELARRCSKGECKESLNDPQIINFLEVADYWCQLAFKRGREFAGLEAE